MASPTPFASLTWNSSVLQNQITSCLPSSKTAATSQRSVESPAGPPLGPLTPQAHSAKFADEAWIKRTWARGLSVEVRTTSCSCQTSKLGLNFTHCTPGPINFFATVWVLLKSLAQVPAHKINRLGLSSTRLPNLFAHILASLARWPPNPADTAGLPNTLLR